MTRDSRFAYTLAEIDALRGLVGQRFWARFGTSYSYSADQYGIYLAQIEDEVRTLMFGGVRAEPYTATNEYGTPYTAYREVVD